MNKIALVYATKTKHSKKLADAIGAALKIKAENVKSSPKLGEIDQLFIVGGLYGGESLPELLEFVRSLDSVKTKSAVLISSSASDKTGQASVRKLLEEKGISITDEFRCFGSFLVMKLGHPNKTDIQKAVDFAVQLSAKGN